MNMRRYQEHSGELARKHKNIFGQYIFTVSAGSETVSVIVGKGLYDATTIGKRLTVGHIGKNLLNIGPYVD